MRNVTPKTLQAFIRSWAPAAELLSVLAVSCFGVAVFINYFVFNIWGLNFLQLSTPTDVVMSGLSAMLFIIPLAVGFAIALMLPVRRIFRFTRKWPWYSPFIFGSIGMVVAVVFFLFSYKELFDDIKDIPRLNEIMFRLIYVSVFVGLAVAIPLVRIIRIQELYSASRFWPLNLYTKAEKSRGPIDWNFVLLSGSFIVPLLIFYRIWILSDAGYLEQKFEIVSQDMPANCTHPLVLWIGEHSLVVDCAEPNKIYVNRKLFFRKSEIVVLRGDQKVALRPIIRAATSKS